jgi:hypothetical protein
MDVQTYLVRLKKNKELVGLFVSPNLDDLWELVDECCSPLECEYVALRAGGVYLSNAGAPKVPTALDAEGSDPGPDWFAGATVSELWHNVFYGEPDAQKWKLVNTDEMDPWLRELG